MSSVPGWACSQAANDSEDRSPKMSTRAAGLDIDQQRPVAVPLAQRELTDTKHPRRLLHGGIGRGS
jgi:hypothetical protein